MTTYSTVSPPSSTSYSNVSEPFASKQFQDGVDFEFQDGTAYQFNSQDTFYNTVSLPA